MTSQTAFRISAVIGFLAVALGAFGAHGLKGLLTRTDMLANWQTAANYHLVHSVVLLLVASRERFVKAAWICFAVGVLIFSGSLYLLALTQLKILGRITPIGGVALLAGWLTLALKR